MPALAEARRHACTRVNARPAGNTPCRGSLHKRCSFMNDFQSARTSRCGMLLGAVVLASLGVLSVAGTASAQRVYVYAPAPAPPRYYYNSYPDPDPPSALAIGADLEGAVPSTFGISPTEMMSKAEAVSRFASVSDSACLAGYESRLKAASATTISSPRTTWAMLAPGTCSTSSSARSTSTSRRTLGLARIRNMRASTRSPTHRSGSRSADTWTSRSDE